MANQFYQNVYTLDTAGTIVCDNPGGLWVRKIVLDPNSAGDVAVFNFYDQSGKYAEGSGTYTSDAILATITSGTTFTMASGTVLPNTCRDGDVFKITRSNGSSDNWPSTNVITSAGNNTVIVCANAGWTNESGKAYNFATYPYRPFIKITSQSTTMKMEQADFCGRGFWLPNLILETLSSSAVVKVYVG